MKRYFSNVWPVLKQYPIPAIWLLIAIQSLGKRHDNFNVIFWSIVILLWVMKILSITFRNFSLFICALSREPILEFDHDCIYDRLGNVNYYWKDINEIVQIGDCLQIHLNDFSQYLDKIKNPIYAWYHINRRKKIFTIDLGYTRENVGEMLRFLNEYSIKAME